MKGIFKKICAVILSVALCATTLISATVVAEEVDYSAYYTQIIERWEETIIGSGEMDTSDPVIADKIASITATAQGYWDTMTRPETENPTKEDYFDLWLNNTAVFSTSTTNGTGLSGHIWSDKSADPIQQGSSDSHRAQTAAFTTNFNRIRAMALAYRIGDTILKGNAEFLKETMYALEFLITYWYADTTVEYGNWWDWNIGIPLALNDTAVLLRDYVDKDFLKECVENIGNFTPHTMLGANLNWRSCIKAVMGAFLEDSSYLETAKAGFEKVLTYVTSSDGFYESDGSFIQHNYFAYIGSYGGNLYKVLSASLVAISDTPWDISDEKKAMVLATIKDSVEPLLVNGQIMELVYGRSVASNVGSIGGYSGGRMIVNALPIFAQMAEGEQAEYLKSLAKEMLTHLTSAEVLEVYDYYADTDLGIYLYAKAILEDETIVPFTRTDNARIFYNMDRIVKHTDKYSLGLAIHSTRTGSYEQANGNNTRGWYQASGTLFIYNDDYKKYSDHYWYTTDFWRMPGATSLYGVEMTSETGSGSSCGQNPWAGGTELGDYVIGSMFMHPADMTLNAKKSYFMFDNEVVALGAGITSSDDAEVETTLENIKLLDDNSNIFTIDGVETTIDADADGAIDTADNAKNGGRLQNAVETTISKYAHISGNTAGSSMGYYFPTSTTLNIVREARTGNNYLINPGSSVDDKTPYTKNYLKMFYSHGLNAADSNSYSYVLLPGATAEQTADYSENADVEILSNTEDIQAVFDKNLNMTGISFWNDGENTVYKDGKEWITSNGAASVMVSETDSEITVAVSDPTQLKTDKFCIEINAATNGVSASHEDITVLQHGDKTIIEIDPTSIVGNKGETKTITLTKGEYVSEEEAVAPTLAGETVVTKEGTAVSKYMTLSGTRPVEFTTDCTVEGICIDRFGTLTVADNVPVGKYTFNVTVTNTAGSDTAEFTVIVISNITPNKTTGAVAYYTFNEGYGTTAAAISQIKTFDSDNFDGDISETVEWVDGFVGTALKFDSISDTLIYDGAKGTYPGSIGMNPAESAFGGATEYDFWVKFDVDPTTRDSDQWIISKGSKEATTNIPWAIKVTKDGKIAFLWNTVAKTSSNWKYSEALNWNEGEWYHINITHNSDYTVALKRDGIIVGTGTTKAGYTNINRVTSINSGAYLTANTDQYFNGTIDELYLGKAGGGEEIRLRSKVSFDTAGAAEIAPQYVDLGGTVTQPENPTKDGYIFIGWLDKDGKAFDFATEVNTDTTVYAGFVDADSKYADKIVSNLTSSSTVNNKVVLYYGFNDGYGTTVSRIGRASIDNCDYSAVLSSGVEWVDGFVGSAVKFDSANDYLKMVSAKNQQGYIGMDPKQTTVGNKAYDFWVSFNEDSADWTADQLILGRDNNDIIPWAIRVTKEGKLSFCWTGTWYDSTDAFDWKAGEWYHINVTHAYSNGTYTITLTRDGAIVGTATHTTAWETSARVMYINGFSASTAVFKDKTQYFNGTIDELYLGNSSYASKLYVRHKVSFNANGGDYVVPAYVWNNETVTATAPTKDGYDFVGWYTDAECTTAYDFSSAVTADITLYAKWKESEVLGDANGDGEVATEDMVLLRQYLLGTLETEIADVMVFDVYADGVINLKDLVRYKKYFAGIAVLGK